MVFLSFCAILLLPLLMAGQEDKVGKKIPNYSLHDRKDIPVAYTWKIDNLFPTVNEWQTEKEAMIKLIPQIDEMAKG